MGLNTPTHRDTQTYDTLNIFLVTNTENFGNKLGSKHSTHWDTQKYDTLGKLLVTNTKNLGGTKNWV